MKKPLVLVGGDFHGVWGPVNTVINRKRPDIILQCGDFGWWPRFHNTRDIVTDAQYDQYGMVKRSKPWNQYGLKNKETIIYWCDGNHEDHWSLEGLLQFDNRPETMPNIFYMRRSSTLELPDGRLVLFLGGADSIDKDSRMIGVDWFPQEIITNSDILNLPEKKIDIVVSHTCPIEFLDQVVTYKMVEPSNHALSYVLNRYQPDLWFFGHFHQFKKGYYKNTTWYALNMVPDPGWWMILP